MKWWLYRLEGAGGETLRSADHPAVVAYFAKFPDYQRLYDPAPSWAPVAEEEWLRIRAYSTNAFLNHQMAKRLLTVRTEWSRK